VFLAMISPLTVGMVAGAIALGRISSGSWIAGILLGLVAWTARVAISLGIARRVRGLAPRIDPFALREPWRFFVRDALTARQRFADAVADAHDGPLRDRLVEIETQLEHAVETTWEVAQRGQQLTDARRRIDVAQLTKTRDETPPENPRHTAARAQLDSHSRLTQREDRARERLELLDAQLDEAIVRASELATRTGGTIELDTLATQVDNMVTDLDSLRLALDEVDGDG
jgi:hypothetical protein